jgi:peptidoglycan/xylan/chitin deacetylase (PgdA/CDA1 family)
MKAVPYEKQDDFLNEIAVLLGFKSSADVPFLGEHAKPMTWNHIQEMHRGGMEFGSHTHHHAILARMKPNDAEQELIISKNLIENHLQIPCTTFCYPIGNYPNAGNELTNELVKKSGYHCATYMGGGVNTIDTDPYFIARDCLGQTTTIEELAVTLAMAGHRIRRFLNKDRSPHARSKRKMQLR